MEEAECNEANGVKWNAKNKVVWQTSKCNVPPEGQCRCANTIKYLNSFIGTAALVWRIYLQTIAVRRTYYFAGDWVGLGNWALGNRCWAEKKEVWQKFDDDEMKKWSETKWLNETLWNLCGSGCYQWVGESIWLQCKGMCSRAAICFVRWICWIKIYQYKGVTQQWNIKEQMLAT